MKLEKRSSQSYIMENSSGAPEQPQQPQMQPHTQPSSSEALRPSISRSETQSSTPIAKTAIERDLENDHSDAVFDSDDESSEDDSTIRQSEFSMINAYRRPSIVNPGSRSTAIFATSVPEHGYLSKKEKEDVRNEERSLLRDNHILPPKHRRRESEGILSSTVGKKLSFAALRRARSADEEAAIDFGPSESTALLENDSNNSYSRSESPHTINRKWDEAVAAGQIHTTWQREAKSLTKTSAPLILTFLLQYSLPVASVFTVGHIGKVELGAVSLAGSEWL